MKRSKACLLIFLLAGAMLYTFLGGQEGCEPCTDDDGDGYAIEGGICGPVDCDDSDSLVNPGAVEICDDGIDNDCDGLPDAADPDCYEDTLFEENFDTDPFSGGRWGVYKYGDPMPGTINYYTDADACGSVDGYIERHYDGHRDVVYEGPPFTTEGYTEAKLTFWYRNSSGASIEAFVMGDAGWMSAATVGAATSWTRSETDLSGPVTGVYFKLSGGPDQSRSLDCISIEGALECQPPVSVTQHPAELSACPGDTAVFDVTATGSSLTYRWRKDGVDLYDGGDVSGAATDTLAIAGVDASDEGDYRCVVTGDCGTDVSNPAALTVSAEPVITEQPRALEVCQDCTATFDVEVLGAGALSYRWQKDGVALYDGGDVSGSGTDTLEIAHVDASDEGDYRCRVSDDCGSTTSDGAALAVTADCGLDISPGGHYVTYDGRTLILVGDSGTQCAAQNSNLDHREWIDDCHDRGIRAVHVWAFIAARQKQDGSVYEDRWGYVYPDITPWARHTSGPPAKDQKYQWNLQAWDEGVGGDLTHYWPRMRDMASYAKSRDMLLGVTIFTGWAKPGQDPWEYHPFKTTNGGHLDSASDAVVIDSPGTEVWQQAWSGSWSNAKKTQWLWERLCIKLIDALGSMGNVFFVFFDEHSYSDGNMEEHFRDFFRSRGQIWMDQNAMRPSVDLVMSATFGGDDKNSNAVEGFSGSPIRPYFFLEGHPYMGDGVRTAIWTFSIGGGSYFFHGDYDQETVRTGIMGYDPYVPGGDKGMYKRDWLGHASRFFNEHVFDLDTMAPHNELSGSGSYCLADPGREYVVYSKIGSSSTFTLDLTHAAGKTMNCRFYDPRTGFFGSSFARAGGGIETFTKPDSNDWTLHVVE